MVAAIAPKGKAECKPDGSLVAVRPGPPPKPKGKGKGKGRGKADAIALPPPLPGPPPAPPVPEDDFVIVVPKASSSSSSKAAAPPPAKPKGVRRDGRKKDFKPAIGGGGVFYDEYEDGFGKVYKNWTFQCPHHGCQRTMGVVPRNIKPHGILQPLAYLHVWRDLEPGPDGHRLTDASPADVTKFFKDHELELENLGELFGIPKPP